MDILNFDLLEFNRMIKLFEDIVGELSLIPNENVCVSSSVSDSLDTLADVYSKLNQCFSNYLSSLEAMVLSLKQVEASWILIDDVMTDEMNV